MPTDKQVGFRVASTWPPSQRVRSSSPISEDTFALLVAAQAVTMASPLGQRDSFAFAGQQLCAMNQQRLFIILNSKRCLDSAAALVVGAAASDWLL